MEAIRINVDYESQLFHGHQGPAAVNQSLEFLSFFLSESPVLTEKTYGSDYLEYVERITGHGPTLVRSGPFKNWWGPLKNLEHERWMNSKVTSTEFNVAKGWGGDVSILFRESDAENVQIDRDFLLKDAFGMSGRGLRRVAEKSALKGIKRYPCILSPLLDRCHDFSHYIYPDGERIAYQNFVDKNFQYKGTLFKDIHSPTVDNLDFHAAVDWSGFDSALEAIISHYSKTPLATGFSVDSFVHRENDQLKICYLSEVNYRRTMGRVAYEIALRFAEGPWCLFVLGKWENPRQVTYLKGVLHLSPHDVRYQIFLLSAVNGEEGKKLFNELKQSLPDCQFTIDI